MKNLIKILLFIVFIISTNSCMVGYTGSVPTPRPYYYSPYYPYHYYPYYGSPYYYRNYPYYRYSPPARPPRQNYGPRIR